MDWIVVTGLAIALTGVLSLAWAIISFFLRRDFSDIRDLEEVKQSLAGGDPMRHAIQAAIYERLYRAHFPQRREGLALLAIWTFSLLFSFVLSAGDTGRALRDYVPENRMWMPMLGLMVVLGMLMWFAGSTVARLRENVLGKADEVSDRYRALCFEERRKFLVATKGATPVPKLGFMGWLNALAGPGRKRRKKKLDEELLAEKPA